MIPLPEWVPNVHPMLVHFPIALLIVAALVDLVGISVPKWSWAKRMADVLYAVGAVSAIGTYFSGREAADLLQVPDEAETTLTDHASWAFRTVWFYGIYALARLVLRWFEGTNRLQTRKTTHTLIAVIALAGIFLVIQTGDRGARLVFKYGVGVQTAQDLSSLRNRVAHRQGGLERTFLLLEGAAENLEYGDQDSTVGLRADDSSVLVVLPDTHSDVQFEVKVNTDQFEGQVQLLHHVQNRTSYDFVSLTDDGMKLGRMENGAQTLFDETSGIQPPSWHTLRVVSDRRHFRAYVDGRMRVHGHGPTASPGKVGLRIEGTGTVWIQNLRVEALSRE